MKLNHLSCNAILGYLNLMTSHLANSKGGTPLYSRANNRFLPSRIREVYSPGTSEAATANQRVGR